MRVRTVTFWAAAAMGAALSVSAPAAAQTAQDRRAECSKEWDAAKAAGKVPEGQTWSKFYSACNTRLKAAEAATKPADAKPADTKAATAKPADTKAKETKAAAPKAEEKAASTGKSRQQQCAAEWKTAKDAGQVPAGQTWPKFYSECSARLSGAAPAAAPAATTAAAPAAAKPAAPATAAASASKSRQQQCAAEWKTAKDAGQVPAGQTWPKFYSECNARLSGAAPAATPAAATAAAKPAAAPAAAAASTGKSRQQQCSEEWKTAKDAGKVPAGQTWPKFYSECNARLSGTAPAATPAAATAAAPAAAKPAAAPAAAAASTGKSRQQQCSEEWKTAKDAGKIPAGETWPKFYSECNTRLLEASPPEPTAASLSTKPKDEAKGEPKGELTPGQQAAHARIRECGSEWRTAKDAGKIPDGQTWPQYWSACNTRLKAAGR